MAKTKIERIESIREQIAKLEKQEKNLVQKQKEEERKAKDNRIIERGGHLETILPDTVSLTFEQFKTFMEKTLLTGHSKKILREMLPPESAAESETEKGAAQAGEAKPEKAGQGNVAVIMPNDGNSGQRAG